MSQLYDAILSHTELDDRDVRLVLTAINSQEDRGRVTQQDIADSVGVSLSTVERRFRKIREKSLMSCTKVGEYQWSYDFSPFEEENDPRSPSTSKRIQASPSNPSWHGIQASPSNPSLGKETTKTSGFHPLISNPSSHVIYTKSKYIREYTSKIPFPFPFSSSSSSPLVPTTRPDVPQSEDPEMKQDKESSLPSEQQKPTPKQRVSGPPSELKDEIEGMLKKPVKKKERFAVRRNRQQEAMEAKEVSEYNCNDLWYVFKREWKNAYHPGFPTKWTIRDRKQMKDLIEANGPEAIVKLIGYVMKNWKDLTRRYSVAGSPTPRVIFGFRRSWIPELAKRDKSRIGREFSGSDIPTGSWG